MKLLTQTSLLFMGLMIAFVGCDKAAEQLDQAKNKGADLVDSAKSMADIDFGSFDAEGLEKKFTGITDGFKNVTADNVDGLTSKISDLDGSIEGMGIDKLPAPAKTFIAGLISKFGDTIKNAMSGISDEGILSKLKPVVEGLMTKLNAFK